MSAHVIYAEIHVRGVTGELYLNGIPLRRVVSPERPYASIPVQQYLVPGESYLELVVRPGPTPSLARKEGLELEAMPGASATARLMRYEEGEFTDGDHGDKLCEIVWQGEADTREVFPKVLGKQVSAGGQASRWSWQDAPPLRLDDPTRAEIAAVLSTVARAFSRGDPAPVLDLLRVRFAEGIRAYPVNDAATLEAELSGYVRSAAAEGWQVRPLDPAAHDFRLCAGDRLVELVDRDWLPTLRFAVPDDDEPIGYPMTLARVDRRLVVVR